ncbi:MAG: SpoIIE family protein phosphatase [Flavobacteriales bacterium]|nr:SpoIIE family protein phosphatase [Flavobacteriales bacterium]
MTESITKHPAWKAELNKTILKYHTIALWVAVVFDLLFFVTDYFNIYDYWQEFLTFRASVSLICLITVLFHKKLRINREVLGVIPVLLISVQNAYMWSVMDVQQFQQHAFAYIALFIGSGMFMFYHVYYSIFIVVVNIVANIIFLKINSSLTADEILVNGGLLTGAVAVFSILLIRMRYRLTKKEVVARHALERSKQEVEEKNNEIVDSINYAKRIQEALIPPEKKLRQILPDSFVIFKPKDIVSGDFYWATVTNTTTGTDQDSNKLLLFSVADCTGHGVPGAFMSIIGLKLFNQSVKQPEVNTPAQALDYLDREIFNTVNLHSEDDKIIRDGMDLALCAVDYSNMKLHFAGANNPVYIVRNKELHEIKGDKKAIGSYQSEHAFTDKEFQLEKGDVIYTFSDGYADQFGGPNGKKLKYAVFKQLLIDNAHLSMEEQKAILEAYFEEWKGTLEQLDDVCVIGMRI